MIAKLNFLYYLYSITKTNSQTIKNLKDMKTIAELNALIPIIIAELHRTDHEIGDESENEYELNTYIFEEDGWEIEIVYKCTGIYKYSRGDYYTPGDCDLDHGKGEIEQISAFHYDEETGEETEFEYEDLLELEMAVEKELEYIR